MTTFIFGSLFGIGLTLFLAGQALKSNRFRGHFLDALQRHGLHR